MTVNGMTIEQHLTLASPDTLKELCIRHREIMQMQTQRAIFGGADPYALYTLLVCQSAQLDKLMRDGEL